MSARSPELPATIAPMLAAATEAFDSEEHLFEIKWDGFRTLAFVEGGGLRLQSRNGHEVSARYPEFAALRELPAGCVLDGEAVVLVDGVPSFEAVLSRSEEASSATGNPAVFVAFDLLYDRFSWLGERPLIERRQRLEELVKEHPGKSLAFSEGVVASGRAFFAQACEQGLEGVVAKELQSRYLPGRRSRSWLKIKRSQTALCVVIGWLESGRDLKSLLLAEVVDGTLRYVGKVGSGLGEKARDTWLSELSKRTRDQAIVPCPESAARWCEPELFCLVRYLEKTGSGLLRAPVFLRRVEES